MSMKTAYQAYIEKQTKLKQREGSEIWINQEQRYIKPFQIYGNLFYVGDNWVCSHLVDTGDGLLLFDAGNCGATALLIQSIWEAGFNPADVKWMVLSHGHVDHIGSANFFRRMFGTKLYLGEPDAIMFQTRPELSAIQESTNYTDELFTPDVAIKDGEVIYFGNTKVQFYLVPGHTEGCIACFFDVSDGEEKKRAGYYGGFGFNTLQNDFLIEIGDPTFENRQIYLESIKKVRNEKVDIFMGNHTNNNNLVEKCKFLLEYPEKNPFLDDQEWGLYLDRRRDEMLELMKER